MQIFLVTTQTSKTYTVVDNNIIYVYRILLDTDKTELLIYKNGRMKNFFTLNSQLEFNYHSPLESISLLQTLLILT